MYKFGHASIEVKWFWMKWYAISAIIGLLLFPTYLLYTEYKNSTPRLYEDFLAQQNIDVVPYANSPEFPLFGESRTEPKKYYAIYPDFYLQSDLANCPGAKKNDEITWCEDFLVRYGYDGSMQDLRHVLDKQ
ncbi:hypothetical protein K2Q16_00855 [Patescibacteria group bacterium]|nr:hypothetical protein [Patescibacteria group bacterium]